MDPLLAALQGIWYIFPAMVPNSAAVLFGGGPPMDFGRKMKDGKPVFGEGKTWAGFFGGIAIGLGTALAFLGAATAWDTTGQWGFGAYPYNILTLIALPVGALLGDLVGSYIKRRLGKERGAKTPLLDMYNFVAGALIFAAVVNWGWFLDRFILGWGWVALLAIIIIMPLFHRLTNIAGYRMGKKKVPW